MKVLRQACRLGLRSFLKAFFSIWRMRSLETLEGPTDFLKSLSRLPVNTKTGPQDLLFSWLQGGQELSSQFGKFPAGTFFHGAIRLYHPQ